MDRGWKTLAQMAWISCVGLSLALADDLPLGWRGDGNGKYPAATPLTTWGRVSTTMLGLRFSADKPGDDQTGQAMSDGVIHQWLILGPVPMPADSSAEKDVLAGESRFDPAEGEKVDKWAWKKVSVDTAWLDFASLLGKHKNSVAYACSRVYSASGGSFRMNLTYVGGVRFSLNGEPSKSLGARFDVRLKKGWNRLLFRASPGDEDWFAEPVLSDDGHAPVRETNIAWRTELPGLMPAFYGGGQGVGAPVVVGERLYLLSEPHDLVCLNKSDGKPLWLRRSSYFEAASDEEKKSEAYGEAAKVVKKIDTINAAFVAGKASAEDLQKKLEREKDLTKKMKQVDEEKYAIEPIPDVGFSGYTPSTDGRFIYTWSGSGVSACYDLDGVRRWIHLDRRPAVEHGFSSSPLLIDGKLIIFMRDLTALDAATGRVVWRTPLISLEGFNPGWFFHGSPVAARIGKTAIISLSNGTIVRASDGKVLYKCPEIGTTCVASPVVDGDVLFHAATNMKLYMFPLPKGITDPLELRPESVDLDLSAFPKYYMPWHLSSPVVEDGLVYLVNNSGVLTVVDVKTRKVVYQKFLDLDQFQTANEGAARGVGISPALAGGKLYFFGNNGAAVVIEPGRVFRQIAKNKIESVVMLGHWAQRPERFVANPVFDGSRIYLRSEGHLYAIGK